MVLLSRYLEREFCAELKEFKWNLLFTLHLLKSCIRLGHYPYYLQASEVEFVSINLQYILEHTFKTVREGSKQLDPVRSALSGGLDYMTKFRVLQSSFPKYNALWWCPIPLWKYWSTACAVFWIFPPSMSSYVYLPPNAYLHFMTMNSRCANMKQNCMCKHLNFKKILMWIQVASWSNYPIYLYNKIYPHRSRNCLIGIEKLILCCDTYLIVCCKWM